MERPILFSGPMIRAILEGRKTQTRRMVKQVPLLGEPLAWCAAASVQEPGFVHIVGDYRRFCPYGQPGDRLWVRETWACLETRSVEGVACVSYRADGELSPEALVHPKKINESELPKTYRKWRPSIFMPRWASRLTLEIVSVRVERLQDISEKDTLAEGVESGSEYWYSNFKALWDSINAARGHGWATNPWVWVVEFKKL